MANDTHKNENATLRRYAKKTKLVRLFGGKCSKCDCNKINILNFHHVDPSTKNHDLYKNKIEEIIKNSENLHESNSYDKEEIYDLYVNQKMKPIEISRKLKVSHHWVKRLIREMGLGRAQKDINIDSSKILELHSKGLTNIDIAKELKICLDTVIRHITKFNLIPNIRDFNPNIKIKITKEEMSDLLKTKNFREIGEMYGVGRQMIYKTCKRIGLKAIYSSLHK